MTTTIDAAARAALLRAADAAPPEDEEARKHMEAGCGGCGGIYCRPRTAAEVAALLRRAAGVGT